MRRIAPLLTLVALASVGFADVVGTWKGTMDQSGMKISGGTMPMPTVTMELRKDGTYTNTYKQPTGERKVSGKWSRKGQEIQLTPEKLKGKLPPALAVSKDEKTITMKIQAKMGAGADAAKNGTPLEIKIIFKRA